MSILFGIIVTLASLLGGFIALGGHLSVIWQPWEFVIIAGMALGTYIIANPWKTVVDTGGATIQAITGAVPKQRDYLDLSGVLHALMREVRNKGRNEVEAHIDDPSSSEIFKNFPTVLANASLLHFICDYFRLIIMGSARPHEIEALMDEEIETIVRTKLKPYHSLSMVAEGLPALGIVAAVLGVIKAMGALDQSPKLLGGFIGGAGRNLLGYLSVLRLGCALGSQDQNSARATVSSLCHRQAIPPCLHERRAAANRDRARPQDDRPG